jgi:hypothetical protein
MKSFYDPTTWAYIDSLERFYQLRKELDHAVRAYGVRFLHQLEGNKEAYQKCMTIYDTYAAQSGINAEFYTALSKRGVNLPIGRECPSFEDFGTI